MPTVEHNGKTYEVNEDGYLVNFDDWDENWVDYVRQSDGMEVLTDSHRKVIENLREHYRKNNYIPLARLFSRAAGESLKVIFELFPSAISGSCKMAGFPRKAC